MPLKPAPPANLPSLNSLRAFEAAARLESFTRAAKELGTTSAGVAQHVKKVESWAEQSLFTRSARGVRLNHAGALALEHLTEGFAAIGRAGVALRAHRPHPSTVRIAALPAIAQLWVVPRMATIRRLLPGVEISVFATDTPPDLTREPYDVSIAYEPVATGGGVAVSDELLVVAAPNIAAELTSPNDLAHHDLLHDSAWKDHWLLWLTHAGRSHIDHAAGSSFTLYAMAIDAALRGEGVLLGRHSLVEGHIQAGTLVSPFDLRVPTGDALQIRLQAPHNPAFAPLLDLVHDAAS